MTKIKNIQKQFPILQKQVNNHDLIYFDNAASTQKPQVVIDTMSDFISSSYANVHRGIHTLGNEATASYEGARSEIASFLNCKKSAQIVITSGATEALNIIIYGLCKTYLSHGDEVVLSVAEHHANIVPWHMLSSKVGFKIIWVQLDENKAICFDSLKQLVNKKTKIISVTHMSNVLGVLNPIKEICKYAKAHNIITIVDGAQACTHVKIDVVDLACDFYVITGHKLFAPTAIGAFYGKVEYLEKIPPLYGGGDMIENVTCDAVSFNNYPSKFEAGTPPIIEAVGLTSALRWIKDNISDNYEGEKYEIAKLIIDYLRQNNNVSFLSPIDRYTPIISYSIKNIHVHDLATMLDLYGIAVRVGYHCAQPLANYYDFDATIRLSFSIYNTIYQAEKYIEAHEKILKILQ